MADAFQEYFGIDGRLWASLKLLLFRPGAITRAYLGGQRVRYLRPLRLYLSATLLFFFLLSVLDPAERLRQSISSGIEAEQVGTVRATDRVATLDSLLIATGTAHAALADSLRARTDTLRAVDGVDLESAAKALEDELGDLDRGRERRLRWQREQLAGLPPDSLVDADAWDEASRVLYPEENNMVLDLPAWAPRSRVAERLVTSRTGAEKGAALADFARSALGQLPTVMFLLLPFFALALKLVYVRRGWYYSEHLVFALHTHAFAFIVFALIAVLIGSAGDAGWASVVVRAMLFTIPVYFFVAQKRVYQQSWFKTGAKALLLGAVYGVALFWGLLLAIVLAASV